MKYSAKGAAAIAAAPSAAPPKGHNKRLAAIVGQIKTLEKRTIATVVDIGRLLEQASELSEHGEYTNWLRVNFGWSHNTSLRYRAIYRLSQNRQIGDFDRLNMSVSALYLLASNIDRTPVRDALVAAAQSGRVSYSAAKRIVEDIEKEFAEEDAKEKKTADKTPAVEPEPEPSRQDEADVEGDSDIDVGADNNSGAVDDEAPSAPGTVKASSPVKADLEVTAKPTTTSAPEPVKPNPKPALPATAISNGLTEDVVGDPETLLRLLYTALTDKRVDAAELVAKVGPPNASAIVKFLQRGIEKCAAISAAKEKADRARVKPAAPRLGPLNKAAADRAEARSRVTASDDLPDIPSFLDRRLH